MYKFLIFSFILSFGHFSQAEMVEADVKESKYFQESAFIKLMANLNGGEIPFPFKSLLDSFGTGVSEQDNVFFVPKGRSLVKDYADFHDPRLIVEPAGGPDVYNEIFSVKQKKIWKENQDKMKSLGIESGDLFMGYAPNHKALEVISYNPKKGSYDFFLIENYEPGKKPRIISNPAICLTCHQNEGPIFPKFPWTEFLGHPASEKVLDSKDNAIVDMIKKKNPERIQIGGINLERKFDPNFVAAFDNLIRQSNQRIVANKFCASLCPGQNEVECPRNLIKIFLSDEKNFSSSHLFDGTETRLNAINIKSSAIPDRDPEKNIGFADYVTLEDLKKDSDPADLLGIKSVLGDQKIYDLTFFEDSFLGLSTNEKITDRTNSERRDQSYFDPTTPRPVNSNVQILQKTVKNSKDFNEKIFLIAKACLPGSLLNQKDSPVQIGPEILTNPDVLNAL